MKNKSAIDDLYGKLYGTRYKYPKANGGPKTVKGVKSEMTKLKKRFRKKITSFFGF